VVHAQELDELDLCADLLPALSHRGHGRVLVVVDEATGKAPQAAARLDRPPAEDDAAFGLDDHRGRDLRVAPKDEVVVRACLQLAAFDDPGHERRAALDAKMSHRNGA